ncbi:hypothetical protein JYU34_004066 [Plutella xylostella]|uniref:Uncharacterized protein n=1 Tax=Plutella xylostella TaxID=51655 RepID=A0ABQ7QX25_PLUXY|nr:hypothetical protein JYU34_004066 [Plutella xylostella]
MRLRCVAGIGTQKRERSVVIGSYDRYRRSYACERDGATHDTVPTPAGLLVSRLGLRAPAQGRMRLRCVAAIGTQKRERSVVIGSYDR